MTAKRIDGKAKAEQLATSITQQTAALLEEHGIKPGLAVVIIGEDPASQVYVRNKGRRAEACGFHSVQHSLPDDVAQQEVLALVDKLNHDDAIHGILVQLPLPGHLDEQSITQSISPQKDVDGFHFVNIGKLTAGHTDDAFVPCTPAGCMLMIEDELGSDLSGLNAVVIGRSNIVGKPMAALLLQRNATVTMTHSRTKDLPGVVRNADIVIAAVGRPDMVKADWIKPGAVIIDVGINRVDRQVDGEMKTKLTGDVDYDDVIETAGAVTPVPGGVGPMTITMLMFNTLRSARLSAGLEDQATA
ncbi:MAG: bifunctional methylenetetrahydrofolate dehydrogenase/methenyltetrahydrofolate cyclohydrolase FolD [Gammaproteobacteria bacterium]|nr:bifunctional methylenetetrahydrofolate dehydrogenase/methenyltetrahydrofolate cyclohydrolase FolD [Gammaproteobacteria bacterium]NNF49366.1 bifunctional methylenetetrahydrofolate dehydrogenase/methenyltetrahydrofolate cyclohydrolase FolD [Woeseiaceae bacterium]MBT8093561.1 bifunctional methylenetetrahydrofolate dehydrogenase/methenyltetrahydrofolate cyclohydrolase FolD [Gammaproteobacteria bacterium]MBT8106475.1 bifunctional methylenetetrahydrofolate dehydrogenase/methenyltetrahydrofolate cyc